MSSHKLSFGLVGEKAAVFLLLLIYRLLLLRYVLVVCHSVERLIKRVQRYDK